MRASDLSTDPLLASFPVHEGYKVLGGVVLYQKLGQGGMGAVYRGKHLRLNVDVALKVMAPPEGMSPSHADNFVQRFIREAQTAASVRHQNLIRVYDVNTEGGSYYLVMDYIDGESAGDRLKRKGKLAEQEAVEIALGAADGLAEAHAQSIVHRDVKPDNILIDRRGAVVVADLGLAKAYSAGETDQERPGSTGSALSLGLSLTQQAMGTPYYMSPEQTRSAKDVGSAADVWSLGVTLYQLVSGELPWSDTDLVELLSSIRKEPAPDVRGRCPGITDGLSDGLCAIIERALNKDAAGRYTDCGEMAKALSGHLDSIRASAESALPDTEAGATKMALVSVTPPPDRTLTLISEEALEEREAPRREDREERPSATKPTLPPRAPARFPVGPVAAAAVALVVLACGATVWFLASRERGEEPRGHDTTVAAPQLPGVGRTGVARTERRSAPTEVEPKVAGTDRYEKWLDEALRLKLAGKPKGAAEAYAWAAKCAPAGSAEARQATAAAAGCMHDYYRKEALEAKSRGDLAGAVEMFERALARKREPETRRLYAEARKALDEKLARELPVVKTKLASAENAENTDFTKREQASLAKEAAKEIARLKKLPPERAAEEARGLLVRFAGTPAAGEIEKIAFGGTEQ